MKNRLLKFLMLLMIVTAFGCQQKVEKLPIYGRKQIDGNDTTYHTIADYKFVNQDSNYVTPATFKDKIYVSDFFFTTCRSICPIMKTQMLRVYEKYKDNPNVVLLSHSIDPEYDTVGLLRDFADKLGVTSDKWHFVTGNKDEIYRLGQTSYMVTAVEDSSEPDGIVHDGRFVLVDRQRRVRGAYDGTKEEQVDVLMKDIDRLLREYGQ